MHYSQISKNKYKEKVLKAVRKKPNTLLIEEKQFKWWRFMIRMHGGQNKVHERN